MSAIVPEAKLVQIALQVFGIDVVIDAADTALNQAPKPLYAIGVNVALHVDAGAVLDPAMHVPLSL